MVLEEIEGGSYAIFQHPELWLSADVPEVLRRCSRQDPKRPDSTAIRFEAMEAYLIALIDEVKRGGL